MPLLLLLLILIGIRPAYADIDAKHLLQPEILDSQSQNPDWFIQGLYFENNRFYVSSGLYGKSFVTVDNSAQRWEYHLPSVLFAEGLTVIGDQLYLLTWKSQQLLILDKRTGELTGTLSYEGEGWGLTHNDRHFIMSNGSNRLLFRNHRSFALEKNLVVKDLNRLNELEYVDGIIWANRWYDDRIYAIDSNDGCVRAAIDLSELRRQATTANAQAVTNGIAYDTNRQGLWVTGKYWQQRFLIKLPPLPSRSDTCS